MIYNMNILTFDIEEWFHCDFISKDISWDKYEIRIHNNVDHILNHLENLNIKATFFCLGWVAQKHPQVLKKIASNGHQIGCHSNIHELIFNFNKSQFKEDTVTAIKSIEDVIGNKINLYRAPAFSITEKNPWAFEVLAENNIEYDCSIFPSMHEYGGFPSFGNAKPAILDINGYKMKEFPINIMKFLNKDIVFSGGGYFRILPYPIIRYFMRHSSYVMTYFHPRDFDADQPLLHQLPLHRKIKSYIGLKNAFKKFERLLNDFEFISVEEADKKIDWNTAKTIKL